VATLGSAGGQVGREKFLEIRNDRMPDGQSMSRNQVVLPLSTLHLELFVSSRKNRARISRILQKVYRIARRLTQDGGGNGPWVFLVDPKSPNRKVPRLRTLLDVRPDEDLWVELVFYPNRARRRTTIRRIWNDQEFVATVGPLEQLISRRKLAYGGTVANASLKPI